MTDLTHSEAMPLLVPQEVVLNLGNNNNKKRLAGSEKAVLTLVAQKSFLWALATTRLPSEVKKASRP